MTPACGSTAGGAGRNKAAFQNVERSGRSILQRSEEEWAMSMRAALEGDSAAYARLLAGLAPALRAVARRNCARVGLDAGEAEDIVQETLLAIHLKRRTWDGARPIVPWILAIARNKMIDARRRKGSRQTLPIDDLSEILPAEADEDKTQRRDLDRLVDRLGERQRDLVRSVSLEGRSIQETAARLAMSEGAVRVALHRAIKTLAALYRKDEA
jgi:RNA polymerase sigma-70 factor (ECF subfamily)